MIYIIRFEQPLGNPANPRGTARYYVGWCEAGRLDRRLQEHRRGSGAAITRAANRLGIPYHVVYTVPGTRADERRIKNYKNTRLWLERRLRHGSVERLH